MRYVSGRGNLAVTAFVPWDCNNNCPFCTSKKDYTDTSNFSLENVIYSIDKVVSAFPVRDLVITGGEPFANLAGLKILLNSACYTNISTYINTTLTNLTEDDLIKFLCFGNIIQGINVSRHIPTLISDSDKKLFSLIRNKNIKLRLNSVITKPSVSKEKIIEFIESYKDYVDEISFRFDYTLISSQDDLRGLSNPFLITLFSIDDLEYLYSSGCLVCNDDNFQYHDLHIKFHRGLETTKIISGNTCIINDIIVKQDGRILLDWSDEDPLSDNDINLIKFNSSTREHSDNNEYSFNSIVDNKELSLISLLKNPTAAYWFKRCRDDQLARIHEREWRPSCGAFSGC